MKPSGPRRKLLIAGAILAALALLAFANYLAGAILFLCFGENPAQAQFFTIEQAFGAAQDARATRQAAGCAGLAFLLTMLLPAGLAMLPRRDSNDLFGKARFANRDDIRQEKLDAAKGVVIGKFEDKLLRLSGYEFVLLAAPTRTGKGVGFCIPNLLQFEDSVVVLDIKGENYNLSSEFRRRYMGNEIVYLNPFSEDTHRWNPLSYVSRDPNFRANDLMALASIVYPPNEKEPFWPDSARNLFVGLGLLVLETPELPTTIGEMLRQASGKGEPIESYLGKVLEARAASDTPLSISCRDALNRFIGAGETALKGIVATFTAALTPFANPVIDKATSADDFDLRDVRKKKMSIYLNIPAGEVLQAGFIVNMFFSQLINENVKELPEQNAALKYQCLLLLDEFTAMGKVAIIAKGVGYMAGYNMRLAIIIQDKTQLDSVYGKEDAHNIVSNMGAVIYFTPSQISEAEEYSKMIGNDTVNSYSTQLAKGSLFGVKGEGGESKTASYQSRAVMLPQELLSMSKDSQLVVRSGIPVIKADKVRYFSDPYFKERFEAVPMQSVSIGGEKRKVPVPVPRPRGDWASYQASLAGTDHYIRPAAAATDASTGERVASAEQADQDRPMAAAREPLPPPGATVANAYADAALRYWRDAVSNGLQPDSKLVIVDLSPGRGSFCWQLNAIVHRRMAEGSTALSDFQYIACAVDEAQERLLQNDPGLAELAQGEQFHLVPRAALLAASDAVFAGQVVVVVAHDWAGALSQPCYTPTADDDFPPPVGDMAAMYRQRMPGVQVAFPVDAIATLGVLSQISEGRFMLLASDVAVDDERAIKLGVFAADGPLLPANYHALAWLLRTKGAAVWQDAGMEGEPSLLLAMAGNALADSAVLPELRAILAGTHGRRATNAPPDGQEGNGTVALARLAANHYDPDCLQSMLPDLLTADWALPSGELAAWRQAIEWGWEMYLPQPGAADFMLGLARVALHAGHLGVARAAADCAKREKAQTAAALDILAAIGECNGRSEHAMRALQRWLELEPDNAMARARLQALELRVQQQDGLPWYRRELAQAGSLWLEPLDEGHETALRRAGAMPVVADADSMACALVHEYWGLVGSASLTGSTIACLEVQVIEAFRGRRFSLAAGDSLLTMARTSGVTEFFALAPASDEGGTAMLRSLAFRKLAASGAQACDEEPLYYLGEETDDIAVLQRLGRLSVARDTAEPEVEVPPADSLVISAGAAQLEPTLACDDVAV
jgi:type IV secretion system protein VirD4